MAQGARLGVDIGGTFTDVALEVGERRWSAKILTTPQAPERAVIEAIQPVLREAALAPGRPHDHHPRDDPGDQRADRAQGRQDRARDHRGLSRHDRDPAREPLRAIRRQHRPAAAVGAAPAAVSGPGADRRAGPGAGCRSTRVGVAALAEPPRGRGDRGGRGRIPAQFHQPSARTPRRRDSGRTAARGPDHAVERGLAGDARIRALLYRLRQRLYPAADRPLSRQSRNPAAPRGVRLPAVPDAVGRRVDRGRDGDPISGAARRIRGRRAAPFSPPRSPANAGSTRSCPTTWAGPPPRSA